MKKLIIFIVSFLMGSNMYGQINLTLANEYVRQASEPGLFVVKQSFQVVDSNGTKFGWNNQKFFSEVYSVGIRTEGGFFIHDRAVHPWEYDSRFVQYKEQYTPVLYETFVRGYSDTTFRKVDAFKLQEKDTSDYYFVSDVKTFGADGFALSVSEGKTEVWSVWFPSSKDLAQSGKSSSFNTIIQKSQVVFSVNPTPMIEPPATSDTLTSGIILIPDFSQIGIIKFLLCGIIKRTQNGFVVTPLKRETSAQQTSDVISSDSGMLTPISDDQKQKQENKKKK